MKKLAIVFLLAVLLQLGQGQPLEEHVDDDEDQHQQKQQQHDKHPELEEDPHQHHHEAGLGIRSFALRSFAQNHSNERAFVSDSFSPFLCQRANHSLCSLRIRSFLKSNCAQIA